MVNSADTPKPSTDAEIAPSEPFALTKAYRALLSRLKDKIRGARLRAATAINREVIELYWHLGKEIIDKQNWGSKLIEKLSQDLQSSFPETSGFSVRNLQRMRQFAAHYPDFEIMPQSLAQLPWGHLSALIHKLKDDEIRASYALQELNFIEKNGDLYECDD